MPCPSTVLITNCLASRISIILEEKLIARYISQPVLHLVLPLSWLDVLQTAVIRDIPYCLFTRPFTALAVRRLPVSQDIVPAHSLLRTTPLPALRTFPTGGNLATICRYGY